MADQTENGDVITQKFSGGAVSWNRATRTFSTEPTNLASSLTGLQVPGQDVPKAPSGPARDTNGDKWFASHWWWLLVIVAALLLLAVVAGAVRWRRRRRERFKLPDDAEPGVDTAMADDHALAAVGRSQDDEDRATARLADYYDQAPSRPPSGLGDQGRDLSAPASGWGFGAGPVKPSAEDRGAREIRQDDDEAVFNLQQDPDAVDTAPTRIESEAEAHSGRHTVVEADEPHPVWAADTHDDAASARTAIHLPLADPYQAPKGYPIKADTKSGLYYTPDSELYNDTVAEIWFASEELARTNGFIKAH